MDTFNNEDVQSENIESETSDSNNETKEGIVYILINAAIPDYVKIGKTTNLEQRIKSLDTTSVPLSFEGFYACTVKDAAFVERQLHDVFSDCRARPNREFFKIDAGRVLSALKLAEIEDVTPKKDYVATSEDQEALDRARMKREAFNFKMVDIPEGAELIFVKDPDIKAIVVDNKTIQYNGENTSLSGAANQILNYAHKVAGPLYWMYKGETLDARRKRIESE